MLEKNINVKIIFLWAKHVRENYACENDVLGRIISEKVCISKLYFWARHASGECVGKLVFLGNS